MNWVREEDWELGSISVKVSVDKIITTGKHIMKDKTIKKRGATCIDRMQNNTTAKLFQD